MANDPTVPQLNLTMGLALEREGMLHPVLIIPVGEVLTGVRATALLAVGGRLGRLDSAGEEIAQLERLHQVAVPDHTAVLGADVGSGCVDVSNALAALVERLLRAEDGHVRLHGFLHRGADLVGGLGTRSRANLVEDVYALGTGVASDL